jgi:hypothetical protein
MPMERGMTAKVNPLAVQANDDVLTVVAISFVAEMFADVLHEGLGHAAVALLSAPHLILIRDRQKREHLLSRQVLSMVSV